MKSFKFISAFIILGFQVEAQDNSIEDIVTKSKALEEGSLNDAAQLLMRLQKTPMHGQGVLRDSACMVHNKTITTQTKSNKREPNEKNPYINTIPQKSKSGQSCNVSSEKQSHFTYTLQSEKNLLPKYEVLVFVSFSHSNITLKKFYEDVQKIGGRLIFRGLHKDSFRLTQQKITGLKIVADVDPTLFEKFNIKEVPTFIVTEPYQNNQPFKYDQLSGNVTLQYALEKFQEEGDLKEIDSLLNKLKEGNDA